MTYLLLFGAGILVKSFLAVRGITPKEFLAYAAGCLFIGFLIGAGAINNGYSLQGHIFLTFFFYTFLFALVFAKKILPRIDEHTVLFWTALAGYMYFDMLSQSPVLMWVYVIVAGALALEAVIVEASYAVIQVATYIWYLICATAVGIGLFGLSAFKDIAAASSPGFDLHMALTAFLIGYSAFYILCNLFYLFQLIPLPAENQSFSARLHELGKFTALLKGKYAEDTNRPLFSALVVGGLLFVFAGNKAFGWISDDTLVVLAILVIPAMFSYLDPMAKE